jgi:hypothetical protein
MINSMQQKKSKTPGGSTPERAQAHTTKGTLSESLSVSSSLRKGISRRIIFTVLSGVMPRRMARDLSGYVGKTNKYPDFVDTRTVAEIRERLQGIPGVRFVDNAGFYAEVREDEEVATSDRLAAAKQIDKVMGYESPARVEINSRREVALAVGVFHRFLGESKLSREELVRIAEAGEGEFEEVGGEGKLLTATA